MRTLKCKYVSQVDQGLIDSKWTCWDVKPGSLALHSQLSSKLLPKQVFFRHNFLEIINDYHFTQNAKVSGFANSLPQGSKIYPKSFFYVFLKQLCNYFIYHRCFLEAIPGIIAYFAVNVVRKIFSKWRKFSVYLFFLLLSV